MADRKEQRAGDVMKNEDDECNSRRGENEEKKGISLADRTVIIATIVGITVAIFLVAGYYNLATSFIGLVLLFTLWNTRPREDHSWRVELSYAGASALAFIMIIGVFVVNPYIALSRPVNTDSCFNVPITNPVHGRKYPQGTYQAECDTLLNPYSRIGIPVLWPNEGSGELLEGEASSIVVAVIGVVVTIVVYVWRCYAWPHLKKKIQDKNHENPPGGVPNENQPLPSGVEKEQPRGASEQEEQSQSPLGLKDIAVTVAILNIPLLLGCTLAKLFRRWRLYR